MDEEEVWDAQDAPSRALQPLAPREEHVLANVAALFAGDASLALLGETVQATVPLIVITATASVGAGAVGAARQ